MGMLSEGAFKKPLFVVLHMTVTDGQFESRQKSHHKLKIPHGFRIQKSEHDFRFVKRDGATKKKRTCVVKKNPLKDE